MVDNTPPTVAVTTNKSTLKAGDTALITFILSESATDFILSDIVVTGGTLSNFQGSASAYTATFTAGSVGAKPAIYVENGKFSDSSGNFNLDGTDADNRVAFVLVPNIAPEANAGSNQNLLLGTVILDGTRSSDANGDQLTYKWSLIAKPPTSWAALSSTTSAKPTFTADTVGSYVVTLLVNDGQLDSSIAFVNVTVSSGNAAPVANAGVEQNVVIGPVTLDGSASSDANGDTLNYRWTLISKPVSSTATLSSTTASQPTLIPDRLGSYAFLLTVNDGKVDSAPSFVVVKVGAANAQPLANAGADRNVTANTLVTLDGTKSSDPNSDTLTYQWQWLSSPGTAPVLSSAISSNPTFTPLTAGTYVLSLTVSDGKLTSTPDPITLTVSSTNSLPVVVPVGATNTAPVANAGTNQIVAVGPVSLDGSASFDTNGDALTYRWFLTSKPNYSLATLSSTTSPKPTLHTDVAGIYVFSLQVSDGKVSSELSTVSVTATTTPAASQPILISGTASNDVLMGTLGNDAINGLAGEDAVVYASPSAAYTLGNFDPAKGISISGPDGNDTLTGIEKIHFKDAYISFDADSIAGQTFRLYQAAFKRTPDLNGLSDWIASREMGMNAEQVASAFMNSAEFKNLYGTTSTDSEFISSLYLNALHRGANADDVLYWVAQLKTTQTRAQVLVSFSESAENKGALKSTISKGILYLTAQQKALATEGTIISGTSANDTLIGTVRSDISLGGSGDDTIYGGAGNDFVTGGSGNDLIDGGAGIDTAIYLGIKSNHIISLLSNPNANDKNIKIISFTNGTDTLSGIERIKFDDVTLAFDTSGNVGQTYRLYQAAFNRTPDKPGLSGWIKGIDGGLDLPSVANSFIQSSEFKNLYGENPSDAQFVSLLYTNALHRAPDLAGLSYWVGQLSTGSQTRAQALIGFAESAENQAALIGSIQNGIEIN